MRLYKLEIQEKKLDKLFQEVSKIEEEDEIKSHLAKYLCVQASGYLENVIKELIAEYHDSTCKKETASFVNNKVKHLSNLNEDALIGFLKSFNDNWVDKYTRTITEKQIASLNSIISQRHLIAHGNGNNSNISFGRMIQYYRDLKDIVGILRNIIKK